MTDVAAVFLKIPESFYYRKLFVTDLWFNHIRFSILPIVFAAVYPFTVGNIRYDYNPLFTSKQALMGEGQPPICNLLIKHNICEIE